MQLILENLHAEIKCDKSKDNHVISQDLAIFICHVEIGLDARCRSHMFSLGLQTLNSQ